jgi:hypothetical protein
MTYIKFLLKKTTYLLPRIPEDEVKKNLMEHNKVPAPDSFSAKFYQSLWDIIKTELLEIFGFFTCQTDIIVSSKF